MSQCLAFVDVVRRTEDIPYWSIDTFLNTQTFRCMRVKFPLSYYDQIVLILTQIEKYFLDIIYTDSDILLATWDAGRFLPVQTCAIAENTLEERFGKDDLNGKVLCCFVV